MHDCQNVPRPCPAGSWPLLCPRAGVPRCLRMQALFPRAGLSGGLSLQKDKDVTSLPLNSSTSDMGPPVCLLVSRRCIRLHLGCRWPTSHCVTTWGRDFPDVGPHPCCSLWSWPSAASNSVHQLGDWAGVWLSFLEVPPAYRPP